MCSESSCRNVSVEGWPDHTVELKRLGQNNTNMNHGHGDKSAKTVDNLQSINVPVQEKMLLDVRNFELKKCSWLIQGEDKVRISVGDIDETADQNLKEQDSQPSAGRIQVIETNFDKPRKSSFRAKKGLGRWVKLLCYYATGKCFKTNWTFWIDLECYHYSFQMRTTVYWSYLIFCFVSSIDV